VCLLQLNIHRFKVLARFGLMHIVATNLCVWIRTLVLESIKEITNNENRKYMSTSVSTVAPITTAVPPPGQHLGQYTSHIHLPVGIILQRPWKEVLWFSTLHNPLCFPTSILPNILPPVIYPISSHERFEVFTAVTMKNCVFWGVTPCDSCKNRRFGGTWHLLHQADKNR
jgi:hypothetical protein